jgi:hypothetical protein
MTHLASPFTEKRKNGKSGNPFRSGDFCGIIGLLRGGDKIKQGEKGKR